MDHVLKAILKDGIYTYKRKQSKTITVLLERKELEKERTIVEIRSLHNEEVRKLYDEMANLRKSNEDA